MKRKERERGRIMMEEEEGDDDGDVYMAQFFIFNPSGGVSSESLQMIEKVLTATPRGCCFLL